MDYKFKKVAIVSTVVLATMFSSTLARADEWNKKTVLTINQPIQISEAYLEPGTYVMKLVDSQSDRHIVRVMDSSETHVIETVLAIPNYRLEPTGKSRFLFWETPAGYAPALRAWFYPGDNFGQEFRRPKQLRQLAVVSQTTTQPVAEEKTETLVARNEEPPVPEPAPTAVEEPPAPAPQPAVEEPAPAAAQQPEPTATSTQLPKTATYAPVMGFSGLLGFALYSLLRLKRA
jgi:hypothetical protein